MEFLKEPTSIEEYKKRKQEAEKQRTISRLYENHLKNRFESMLNPQVTYNPRIGEAREILLFEHSTHWKDVSFIHNGSHKLHHPRAVEVRRKVLDRYGFSFDDILQVLEDSSPDIEYISVKSDIFPLELFVSPVKSNLHQALNKNRITKWSVRNTIESEIRVPYLRVVK